MPSDAVPSSLRMPGMRCVWPSSAQQAACMSLLPLSYYRSCSPRGAKFASRFVTREAFKASLVTPVFRTEHFFASNANASGACENYHFPHLPEDTSHHLREAASAIVRGSKAVDTHGAGRAPGSPGSSFGLLPSLGLQSLAAGTLEDAAAVAGLPVPAPLEIGCSVSARVLRLSLL